MNTVRKTTKTGVRRTRRSSSPGAGAGKTSESTLGGGRGRRGTLPPSVDTGGFDAHLHEDGRRRDDGPRRRRPRQQGRSPRRGVRRRRRVQRRDRAGAGGEPPAGGRRG